MAKHLKSVDPASAAEIAAALDAFEWAVDALGILPPERALLIRPQWSREMGEALGPETERRIRRIVSIATDLAALLGDADEMREWMRRPNPAIRDTRHSRPMSPIRVMLDYEDGVRAIRVELACERERRFGCDVGSGRSTSH